MTLNLDRTTWTRVRFGDVVSNVNETIRNPLSAGIDRVIAMEHLDPGELEITRWGNPEDGTTFTRRVRPGQTLFGKRRAYQRKAAYAEFDAICSGDILTFQANSTKLLPELLPFLVQSDGFYEHALGTSAGSLSPRTNWKDLANYEFDLPPLDEQHRIAKLLWAADAARLAAQQAVTATRRARCVDRLLLLKGGPSVARTDLRLRSDAVNSWTEHLPDGWTGKTLGELCVVRSGATPSRSQNSRYFSTDGSPWVKTLDLNEDEIVSTQERISAAALAETACRVFEPGTVLVAMYGGFAQIGRTGRLGIAAATNQALSALTEVSPDVEPRYLHEVLKAGRERWRKVAASSRKDPNITKRDVENFEFPLPPRTVQSEILAILAKYDSALDKLETERNRAENLVRRLTTLLVEGEA